MNPWRDVLSKVRQLQRRGSATVVAQLSDGDTFGHSALIRGRHQNDVHAITYINLLMLHADKLDILAREFEPLRNNIKQLAKASLMAAAAVDKGTRKRLSVFQRNTSRSFMESRSLHSSHSRGRRKTKGRRGRGGRAARPRGQLQLRRRDRPDLLGRVGCGRVCPL